MQTLQLVQSKTNRKQTVVNKAKATKHVIPKGGDERINAVLKAFLNSDETRARIGSYFIDGNSLYYRVATVSNGAVQLRENLVASKLQQSDGTVLVLGNSSTLPLIGETVAWGNRYSNRGETEIQQKLSLLVPMLPFTVFETAKLDLSELSIVERGDAETLLIKRDTGKPDKATGKPIVVSEHRHFTGASLFSIGAVQFLFDVDRRELKHEIFNAFLVKLPVSVNSIAEAYESLKPTAVVAAENAGLDIKRQGEFFFIPVNDTALETQLSSYDNKTYTQRIELRAGPNRPNYASGIQMRNGDAVPVPQGEDRWQRARENNTVASEYFVKGKVEHSGREHAALILKGWYRAVANTASESFTITGDVD